MPSSTSSNADPNPEPPKDTSQHPIQPQNKYGWLTTFIICLFQWVFLPVRQVLVAVVPMALGRRPIINGREQQVSVDVANEADVTPHRDSSNPPSMQAEGRNPLPSIAGPATIPVATQLQDAQNFTISGNPVLTNIGMNTGVNNVTTVNNYGGTHGLENLKDFVSFAALHDSAEQDYTRRCHPGTRKNVLSRLRNWFDNLNGTKSICWLHGPAGAGKSAIAQTIAHEYKERGVAATFFFYRSDTERNNGNRLFPTLAWQLAFSIPAIKDFIVRALDKTPHLPRKDIESQFEQLVAYPFHPTNNIASQLSQSALVVIIDGLDECSEEQLQRRILAVIGNAVKERRVPLHFLICSRPESLIEEVLDQFKDFTLRIDLATLDDSNRDIEKYLVDQFSDIRSKRGLAPTWPGQKIIEELVVKSSGYFIFAATVMRCTSDEDCDPEEQLNIVRNLKPGGNMSPFALLDELYLEVLKRQRDQDFLKTFLALLVVRSSIDEYSFHEDDAMLMNISEKNLHVKLRKMRSLLKFKPFIDVYHKSFLDFLEDPSRSGEYHVSKQGGQKRYLELIVGCVVRHVSMAIQQPNIHEECRSKPNFRSILQGYPPKVMLPVEDWQEALHPFLDLQDRLLNTLKPQPCHFSQAMRELLLHLAILQGNHHIATTQEPESNINETVMERTPTIVTDIRQNISENDLDGCLSMLLSCLQKTNSALVVDTVIIERMSSLLAFDHSETVARVRSVTDAQKLIDIIDLLIHNETFLSNCGPDAVRKAALVASEIYSRVPLLPCSIFLNGPIQQCDWFLEVEEVGNLELACQSTFITRILDHNCVIPLLWMYQGDQVKCVYANRNNQYESVDKWLRKSKPNFVTRIRIMLEIGKAIQYIHSMDAVAALHPFWILLDNFVLDLNLHVKFMFHGHFAWQVREKLVHDIDGLKSRAFVNARFLNNVDIANISFDRVDFANISFDHVDFANLSFDRVNFTDAHFTNVNFAGAGFHHVDFAHAHFTNVDFAGASFDKDNFANARFTNIDFAGASFDKDDFANARFTNVSFVGAGFDSNNFANARFTNVSFVDAGFGRDNFAHAHFTNVDFGGASFDSDSFADACFTGTYLASFANAGIANTNFANARFDAYSASFANVTLATASFTSESNMVVFAKLFEEVCFDDDIGKDNLPSHLVKNVKRLIKRCLSEDLKIQPTLENVIKEMETWNLT